MLAPGEQPRPRPVSWRAVVGAVVVCGLVMVLLSSQAGPLNEYRLYLTEDRKPAALTLSALSEDWTETTVRDRFSGFPINCNGYQGPLPVQRVCTVDVESVNGIPALFMTFLFAGGHLDQLIINIPWWSHSTSRDWLIAALGSPIASDLFPQGGLRLLGWRLDNGAGIFFNRDWPYQPPFWNSIYWRSPSGCGAEQCFKR